MLQTAEESFLALPAGLPSLDDFVDARLRLGDGGGQGIGIIGYGPRDGILAVGLRQGRQGLYSHPGRIACHLDGQAPLGGGRAVVIEQRIEAECAGVVALQVEGQGFCQGIFVPFGVVVDDNIDKERNGGFGSTDTEEDPYCDDERYTSSEIPE